MILSKCRRAGFNSNYISGMNGVTSRDIVKIICVVTTYWISLTSCHKTTPAGFWLDFRKDLIVKSISDQGPYGGKREIFWKATGGRKFSSQEFIEFAKKNSWQLMDSIFIPLEMLKKWTNNNTFPFTYSQFSDSTIVEVGFPIWIEANVELYRFSTGWVAIQPGSTKDTEKNGYIVFQPDGSRVAVYHLWGE
jgi:hypothetical protein